AVGLVVLVAVRDEIAQREAVVRGHEIDRGVRAAAAATIQVAGAGEPVSHRAGLTLVALPVSAHGVPVHAVPFGPQHGKVADLVASLTQIPWLGDELDARDDRILVNDVEE